MRKPHPKVRALLLLCAGILTGTSGRAGTATYTFNTDPRNDSEFIIQSNVYDSNSGLDFYEGANGDPGGYIAISRAVGGQSSQILFPDFDKGLVVRSFTFECDLRLGNPTSGSAADGFSISYARAGDPAVNDLLNGANSVANYANQLPEAGTTTGLAVSFDTWAGNDLPDGRDWPNTNNGDPGGILVRVDNVTVYRFRMPTQNGTCTDITSLQTGPQDTGTLTGGYSNLCWAHLKVELNDLGQLTVTYKGTVIIDHLQTSYAPSAGRIVVAGRTGGSNENNHMDNLTITTVPSDKIVIGSSSGEPAGFTAGVSDSGSSIFDATKAGSIVSMSLNGNSVTATSSTKGTNGVTTIRYSNPPVPITPGTTNTVVLSVKDTNGIVVSNTNSFVGVSYLTLNPATAASNVDKTQPGFTLRMAQVAFEDANGTSHVSDVNTGVAIASAERILHGDLGPNTADLTYFTGPNKTYNESKVINYNAKASNLGDYADDGTVAGGTASPNLPGLPGTALRESGLDDAAMEILTYIEFPKQGSYRLTFNSDDGFRMTTAANPREVLDSTLVSQADVGRGSTPTTVWVYVPTAGIYPFRSLWLQGGGDAALEWSAISEDGVKALVNDSTTTGSLKAYRVNNGAMPAAVSFVDPPVGSGRPPTPGSPLVFEITDGATAVSGIKLTVNGTDVTPTITKSGNLSKVVYTPSPMLPVNNSVVLSFTDGSKTYTGTNTFTAAQGIEVPPSMALKASDVDTTKSGFLIHTWQVGITNNGATGPNHPGNTTVIGEIFAHQWWGWPNRASLASFTGPGSSYVETSFINYNGGAPDSTTAPTVLNGGNAGTFPDDGTMGGTAPDMPGIVFNDQLAEGGVDDYALEIRTVLDLQPGTYDMGINSDDGFRMIVGDGKEAFTLPAVAGEYSGGRGADNWGFTRFTAKITQAGLYPFRLLYEEGTGGNNVEWLVVNKPWYPDQLNKTLVNDKLNNGIKAYQYPINSTGPTYVKSFAPGRYASDSLASVGRAGPDATVSAVLVDGSTPVDKNSVVLKINGTAVTPAIAQASGQTTITYKPASGFAMGSTNSVALTFTDRTVNWSFVVGLPATPSFWIESSDYDFGGGQTKAEASVMPYAGGAYAGLSAVAGTDYDGPNGSNANPYYRYPSTLQTPVTIASDFDRGGGEVSVDYRLGWMGGNHWFNYTRTFPAGDYNVYAALSSGTAGDHIYGNLAQVSGGTNTVLGAFSGTMVTTGGGTWGNNNLVPLRDAAATNNLVKLTLSGTTTLRYNDGSGDFDFLLFTPAGNVVTKPNITGLKVASGSITFNWTGGGTVQTSTDLATWTDVSGATTGTYTAPATDAHRYFRIRQ